MTALVHEFRRPGGSVLEFGTHVTLMDRAGAGPHAVELLERFEDRETSEEGLLASVRAAARVEAHAAWLKARYAAKLASSARLAYPDYIGVINVAAEEISVGLRVSTHLAERYVKVGGAITGALCATGDALEVGVISFEHAWVITDCLSGVDLTVAIPVEELALERAVERTPAELRRDIARLLIEFDPETADDRARVAAGKRRVGRPRPAADGMARMSLFLPAPDAVTLDSALDAAATAARGAGDCRTTDQLRADTMTGWAKTALTSGTEVTLSDGSTVTSAPAKIAVTIPLEVMMRAIPGFTPPPSVADVFRADLAGTDNPDTATDSCEAVVFGPVDGHRTEAAWLEGYGPISPAVALLLAAGGTWQRIVTDPLTGLPLDIGRARYAPPSHIRTATRLRDHTCVRPGCSIPSHRCDGDHVHEWAQGGVTSLVNHAPECPRHHRIKTAGAANVGHLQADGTRTWTSALGKKYRRLPERPLRQRGGAPPDDPPGESPPDAFEGPPPF